MRAKRAYKCFLTWIGYVLLLAVSQNCGSRFDQPTSRMSQLTPEMLLCYYNDVITATVAS